MVDRRFRSGASSRNPASSAVLANSSMKRGTPSPRSSMKDRTASEGGAVGPMSRTSAAASGRPSGLSFTCSTFSVLIQEASGSVRVDTRIKAGIEGRMFTILVSRSREVVSAHCSSSKVIRIGSVRARRRIQSMKTCSAILRWRSALISVSRSFPVVGKLKRPARMVSAMSTGAWPIDKAFRSFRSFSSTGSLSSTAARLVSSVRNGYSVLFSNAGEHCIVSVGKVRSLCCIS